MRNLPFMPKVPFQRLFPSANPDALDLLDRMLSFDPTSRISVEEALEHPYLHIWHDASDEPTCPSTFDFHFEVIDDVQEMRRMIFQEVVRFRAVVRQQSQAQAAAAAQQQQLAAQQTNVPIPDNQQAVWRNEEPKPQEATAAGGGHANDLEESLQRGMDAL